MARRTNAIYYPGAAPRIRGRVLLPIGSAVAVQWAAPASQPHLGLLMATSSTRGAVGVNARPVRTRRMTLG